MKHADTHTMMEYWQAVGWVERAAMVYVLGFEMKTAKEYARLSWNSLPESVREALAKDRMEQNQ